MQHVEQLSGELSVHSADERGILSTHDIGGCDGTDDEHEGDAHLLRWEREREDMMEGN